MNVMNMMKLERSGSVLGSTLHLTMLHFLTNLEEKIHTDLMNIDTID